MRRHRKRRKTYMTRADATCWPWTNWCRTSRRFMILLGIVEDSTMQHCPRSLLVTFALALLVTLPAADAQPPGKVHRIGLLNMGPSPSKAEWQQSPFLQELRQLGYVEGQNIVI